jgi:hypothetical protein
MRKFVVLGASVALLAGSTAAMSIASAVAAPKKILVSAVQALNLISQQAWLMVTARGKNGPGRGERVTEPAADAETPRLYLIETDYDGGPRARFGRLP